MFGGFEGKRIDHLAHWGLLLARVDEVDVRDGVVDVHPDRRHRAAPRLALGQAGAVEGQREAVDVQLLAGS